MDKEDRREYDANENPYKREQRAVQSSKADWEFLRDTVTPPPFYHNEHAWTIMWSLIQKRVDSPKTQSKEVQSLVEALKGLSEAYVALCENHGFDHHKIKGSKYQHAAQVLEAYRESKS